ncbi:flagellar hook-length control protein FliK [Pseudomonadota bacterium AL_CKDN230030165-1A_HGKHYDSX7]
MSVGPPALGNVLVQRLDAVLGTSMAAHANLIPGARPGTVPQPGESVRPGQDGRRGLDQLGGKGGQTAVLDAKTAAALALAARGTVTRNDTTSSAPTTLGSTARTILALLASFPDQAPPIQGRAPLFTPQPQPQATGGGATVQPQAQPQFQPQAQAQAQAQAPAQPATPAGQPAPAAQAPAPASTAAASAAVLRGTPLPAGAAPAHGAQSAGPVHAPHSAVSPAQLAQTLRQTLATSGIFYESHLTEMVFGKRTPAELRSEPQASLPQARDVAQSAEGQKATQAAQAARSATPLPPGAPDLPDTTQSLLPQNSGLNPDTTALVRQQLEALANQMVSWRGEAWPGTPMEWEVKRDPYGEDQPGDPEGHWSTRLTLELPRLGQVEARISLAGTQLVLNIVAPNGAVELNQQSEQLRQRLGTAGITLSNLSIDAMPPQLIMPPGLYPFSPPFPF